MAEATSLDMSFIFIYLFVWLHGVLVAARGIFVGGLTCGRPHRGSLLRPVGVLVSVPGLHCSVVCGIFVPRPGIETTYPAFIAR